MKKQESQEKFAERLNSANKKMPHNGIGRFYNFSPVRLDDLSVLVHESDIAMMHQLIHRAERLMIELSEINRLLTEVFYRSASTQSSSPHSQCCESHIPRQGDNNRNSSCARNRVSPLRQSHKMRDCQECPYSAGWQSVLDQL